MLRLWDATVGYFAMAVIILTALGVMVRMVEAADGVKRIAATLGCSALLIILPAIIVGIWLRLTLWEQIGVCAVCGLVVALILRQLKGKTHRTRRH
jgi:hypothetical protein